MELIWARGDVGPATTQELADLVEKEGRLGIGGCRGTNELNCLWDVINSNVWPVVRLGRLLSPASCASLIEARCGVIDNDHFLGTPEERCAEFVRRLRAIL